MDIFCCDLKWTIAEAVIVDSKTAIHRSVGHGWRKWKFSGQEEEAFTVYASYIRIYSSTHVHTYYHTNKLQCTAHIISILIY